MSASRKPRKLASDIAVDQKAIADHAEAVQLVRRAAADLLAAAVDGGDLFKRWETFRTMVDHERRMAVPVLKLLTLANFRLARTTVISLSQLELQVWGVEGGE